MLKDGAHPVHTEVIVWKQYELLRTKILAVGQDEKLQRLQLWIMCMSAFEAARLPDRAISSWFVQGVASLVDNGTDLIESLQSVLWMPLLFDQQLNALREEISLLR